MLLGQLPSQIAAGSAGMYSGAGYAPALMQAFLGRFGPYRLQAYEVPQIPAQYMTPTFQPRGLRESGLLPPALPRWQEGWRGRFGGNGRTGGGPRSADRNGANRSGGKASGPGGPAGGRSGPVSR